MKNPLKMNAKIGNLKIIQVKKQLFVGSLNKKITTGILISSKLPNFRKDGMIIKYASFSYQLSQDIGKLTKIPLPYEARLSSNPLLAKKYIKEYIRVI
jgi:ribosomal protein L14